MNIVAFKSLKRSSIFGAGRISGKYNSLFANPTADSKIKSIYSRIGAVIDLENLPEIYKSFEIGYDIGQVDFLAIEKFYAKIGNRLLLFRVKHRHTSTKEVISSYTNIDHLGEILSVVTGKPTRVHDPKLELGIVKSVRRFPYVINTVDCSSLEDAIESVQRAMDFCLSNQKCNDKDYCLDIPISEMSSMERNMKGLSIGELLETAAPSFFQNCLYDTNSYIEDEQFVESVISSPAESFELANLLDKDYATDMVLTVGTIWATVASCEVKVYHCLYDGISGEAPVGVPENMSSIADEISKLCTFASDVLNRHQGSDLDSGIFFSATLVKTWKDEAFLYIRDIEEDHPFCLIHIDIPRITIASSSLFVES